MQNENPVLYKTLKSLSLYCVCPSLDLLSSSFSLKLHISFLSAGKKAAALQQILLSPLLSTRDDWKVKPISQCLEFHS